MAAPPPLSSEEIWKNAIKHEIKENIFRKEKYPQIENSIFEYATGIWPRTVVINISQSLYNRVHSTLEFVQLCYDLSLFRYKKSYSEEMLVFTVDSILKDEVLEEKPFIINIVDGENEPIKIYLIPDNVETGRAVYPVKEYTMFF